MPKERVGTKEDFQQVIDKINKDIGPGTVMTGNTYLPVEAVSSGNITIDVLTGVGGFPRGRIIEIYGLESSGKTSIALKAIASNQAQGGRCVFIDMEHSLDPIWATKMGVNLDDLILSQPDSGEDALTIAEQFVRSNMVDLIVIDSVAALVPRAEIQGEMGDSHMALQARLMSQALRKISGAAKQTDCTIIFINQVRENIGVMFGSKYTTSGGRALKFYSSIRLDVRRIGGIKSGGDEIGSRVKVKIVKNKVAPPFKEGEVEILYDTGLSLLSDIMDYGVQLEFIKKRGAWFSVEDENGESHNIAQGRENLRAYLIENQDFTFELHNAILHRLGFPTLENAPTYGVVADRNDTDGDSELIIDEETGEVIEDNDGE